MESATEARETRPEIEKGRWLKRSKSELDTWVGEDVPEGEQEEDGTKYEFQMWEREED